MTVPARGMDHGHYAYAADDRRPGVSWPGGARLAVIVLLHLEFWELEPPEEGWSDPRFRDEMGRFTPDYRGFTQREYGNRVGIFRVLEALDRTTAKLTVPVNTAALERYPNLVSILAERGAEFVGHGTHQNRMVTSKLGPERERELILRCLDAVEKATGQRPRGWAGPDFGESWWTPEIAARIGLDYVVDWPNDDRPYLMTTEPPIVSVPPQIEWDDVHAMWVRKVAPWAWSRMVADAAEGLHAEGGRHFVMSLHPWVAGQAHRIRYVEEALEAIGRLDGLWHATAGEVARVVKGQGT